MSARTVFVAGAPAPQGSKRHVGRGVLIESSKAVGPWRERIAVAAHSHARGLLSGPVALTLDFVMPRPKSAPKRSTPPAVKRPDIDKLARAVLDALTDVWLADDSQVVSLHATKRIAEIGEAAGVRITAEAPTHCIACRTDNPPLRPAGCGPECIEEETGHA
ncbi:RusA family crossover junction endodeoxyribonuclease [Gordonia sp. WA4-43]|uniref:RusA family crossover junction endodeoxyribonuclease n=1 Tax=Gordonia sp. WA4-43 TaxID=2878678 RepID=UPI001CFAAE04|nr:RusA family crossover junction endodeoxyribonuclease [Gordonia sp. WA4-43]UCZ89050.1 RusA family crossover junction endodeoxyribonuclease [Gordonia sp. WA4-43]